MEQFVSKVPATLAPDILAVFSVNILEAPTVC